jgi:hypothetical protein
MRLTCCVVFEEPAGAVEELAFFDEEQALRAVRPSAPAAATINNFFAGVMGDAFLVLVR